MKTQVLWCSRCKEYTPHFIKQVTWFGESGSSRIFDAVFTLGMSEIDNITQCECSKCGRTFER